MVWKQATYDDPNSISLLLSLPTELRIMILELVLVSPVPLTQVDWGFVPNNRGWCNQLVFNGKLLARCFRHVGRAFNTSIMQTCQRMHVEGAMVLYGRNKFIYHATDIGTTPEHSLYQSWENNQRKYGSLVRRVIMDISFELPRDDPAGFNQQDMLVRICKYINIFSVPICQLKNRGGIDGRQELFALAPLQG